MSRPVPEKPLNPFFLFPVETGPNNRPIWKNRDFTCRFKRAPRAFKSPRFRPLTYYPSGPRNCHRNADTGAGFSGFFLFYHSFDFVMDTGSTTGAGSQKKNRGVTRSRPGTQVWAKTQKIYSQHSYVDITPLPTTDTLCEVLSDAAPRHCQHRHCTPVQPAAVVGVREI